MKRFHLNIIYLFLLAGLRQGIAQHHHLRQAPVTSACEDRWGNMWLGTWGLGELFIDVKLGQAGAAQQLRLGEPACRSSAV